SIRKTVQLSKNYRYSSTLALKEAFENIDRHNPYVNAFISLHNQQTLEEKAKAADQRRSQGESRSLIDGMTVAVKDNICTSFLPTTCASNMLKDFTSPYDATVVELLDNAGALIVGKTNLDEFGMGSANVHSAFGPVLNPMYKGEQRSAGGSSGGSAASVAMKMCTAALGSDTGGSVRMPASYCGLVGFKPSYGRCSRHGLIAYANSLDTVGILTRNVSDCANVYDIISCYDHRDPTSIPERLRTELDSNDAQFLSKFQDNLEGLVVGVPQEFYVDSLSPQVIEVWRSGIKQLEKLGAEIVSVSIPHLSLALPAYYIIALAEASSNLARYDGIRFGHRSPDRADQLLYQDTRSSGFGDEVQKRILLGTHVLTAGTYETLFLPAQSARSLIRNEFNKVFRHQNLLHKTDTGQVDILLAPGATSIAPALNSKDGVQQYIDDVMTLPANLVGIPALTVPFSQSIGLQLLGQYGYDKSILRVAELMMNHN
ncbi:Trimeric GatFAB AmidoTransferase(AdT) complex subunit, partial [Rhizopus stolonifer]